MADPELDLPLPQVRYWTEKGAAGFLVYRYQMQRRPDQGELSSKALIFGGGCALKHHNAESREKEVRLSSANPLLYILLVERRGSPELWSVL